MEPFRYHVYVCDQQKPEGAHGCATAKPAGSAAVIGALHGKLAAAGLSDEVQVTATGSQGLCDWGPNMVVYPDGVWYSAVTPADLDEIIASHFQQGRVVERLAKTDPAAMKQEILLHRGMYLAGMKAKDEAGALPDALAQTIRGFQESRVILTAVELDLFNAVGAGATPEQAAERMHTDPRATAMLMHALAAMQLLEKRDGFVAAKAASRRGVFYNTPTAARYFVAGSRDDWRCALLHTAHLWRRWSTLTDCVRTGAPAAHEEMADRGDDWTQPFIAAMDRNAAERAPHVVRAVGAANVHRMLDVGGGSGAYSIAFARASDTLHADLLDLDTVLPIAQLNIHNAGLAHRIRTCPGDLRHGPLGSGYDLVFISAICHMLNADENRDLLRRSHDALAPAGRVVIQDFILEPEKTAPKSATLFALNMLVGTKAGSTYSEPEYASWLTSAGFSDVKRIHLPGPSGLMFGSKT